MNRKWFICDPLDFPYNKEIIIQENIFSKVLFRYY